jgi:DNA-directed RNA polymerase specialized sigma24 family protein
VHRRKVDGHPALGEDRIIKFPAEADLVTQSPCTGESIEALVKAESAAVEMYRFAALMLGNEAEALDLVESTVAGVDIDPCADPSAAKGLVRERVLDGALKIMQQHDPASFADLPATDAGGACIEDDTVPLSRPEISELVAGAGRGPLRDWLARLSQAQRAVFVQRAVLGSSNADTAQAINRHSRPSIWTAEAVSSLFRQALCSLASSLVHSSAAVHI